MLVVGLVVMMMAVCSVCDRVFHKCIHSFSDLAFLGASLSPPSCPIALVPLGSLLAEARMSLVTSAETDGGWPLTGPVFSPAVARSARVNALFSTALCVARIGMAVLMLWDAALSAIFAVVMCRRGAKENCLLGLKTAALLKSALDRILSACNVRRRVM